MKKRRDPVLVRDIIDAIALAQSFLESVNQAEFLKDLLRQAAICRQLEIIGEAATRLSPDFRRSATSIPWRKLIGMRNILIHMYEEVDLEELWSTVKKDLPKLASTLERIIAPAK